LESVRDFNYEIYVMNADGNGATQVSNSPGSDEFNPRWSPDGSKVAFESIGASDYEIISVNVNGDDPANLSQSTANEYTPVWIGSATPQPEPGGGGASAEEMLIELISDVEALPSTGVNSGQANALAQQLKNALRSAQGTRAASACDKIDKFIKDVDKKSPRFIAFPVRDDLIAKAEAILVALGCGA
jgi:hypothetical protein